MLIAAQNRSREEVSFEVADLMYHLTVLLADQGNVLGDDIYAELEKPSSLKNSPCGQSSLLFARRLVFRSLGRNSGRISV